MIEVNNQRSMTPQSESQIQLEGQKQRTCDSGLEYSADRLQFSQQSSYVNDEYGKSEDFLVGTNIFDDNTFKRQIKEMQNRVHQNSKQKQSTKENNVNQHCSSVNPSKQNQNDILSQQSEESRGIDCDVSEIRRNASSKQDLSLLHCERSMQLSTVQRTNQLEHKVHILMEENMKISRMNENLFREVEQLREFQRQSNRPWSESRDILLKNTQITELQRRIFEIERDQIEKQSEEYAQVQSLERRTQQLSEQNANLQRQGENLEKAKEVMEAQLEMMSEQLQEGELCENERNELNRVKAEFDELQRLTQNVINQEEEYQKRICELEQEQCEQNQIQEELVNRIKESEQIFGFRMEQEKEQVRNEMRASMRRHQEQNQHLNDQNQYLYDQVQQSEANIQNIEQYYLNEISNLKNYYGQQLGGQEMQLKKMYEKQLQDKNFVIEQLQDQGRRYDNKEQYNDSKDDLDTRSKSVCGGLAKNYYMMPLKMSGNKEEMVGRGRQISSMHHNSVNSSMQIPLSNYSNKLNKENYRSIVIESEDKSNTNKNCINNNNKHFIDLYTKQKNNNIYLPNKQNQCESRSNLTSKSNKRKL